MMKKILFQGFTLLTLATLSGCGTLFTEQASKQMDGADIVSQLPGHTLVGGITNFAGPWATYVQKDGIALFRTPEGEILETQWSVAGDRFCYSDVGGIEKICMSVASKGDGYRFADQNGRESVYATKKTVGDTLNLRGFLDSQRTLSERRARQMQLDARRTARTQPLPIQQ